jgi:hypothetical protein
VNTQFMDQFPGILNGRFPDITGSLTERFLRAVSEFLEPLLILFAGPSHGIIPLKA